MRWSACLFALLTACTGAPELGDALAVIDLPEAIAVATTDLYVAGDSDNGDQLVHTSTDGGTPTVIGEGGVIATIAADATGVYWHFTDAGEAYVMRNDPGSTTAVELFHHPSRLGLGATFRNLVIDDASVYYADQGGRVWKIPKAGGTTMMLGMTNTARGAVAVAPDGVWVSTLHGAKRLPDGAVINFAIDPEAPSNIVWADGALFATFSGSGNGGGRIVRVTFAEGPIALADQLTSPSNLVAHDGYLYFTEGGFDATIRRVAYAGGAAQVLATARTPSDVAVDANYVYWSDWHDGGIRRVPR